MRESLRKLLWGLGFDAKDGHLRITRGKNFRLYGGSKPTHERMQEKAIKFNEQLKARGKTIDEVGREEFNEIAGKIGLKPLSHEDEARSDTPHSNE